MVWIGVTMIKYSYEQFIKMLNSRDIISINFFIEGYAHYKNCNICCKTDTLPKGAEVFLIEVNLTNDNSEKIAFYKTIDEKYKFFDFKRKGKFTLKEIWNKVIITQIILRG